MFDGLNNAFFPFPELVRKDDAFVCVVAPHRSLQNQPDSDDTGMVRSFVCRYKCFLNLFCLANVFTHRTAAE